MSASPPQFEFSTEDSAVFSRLAVTMRRVGFWFEVYGAALIVVFAFKLIPRNDRVDVELMDLVAGLVFLFLGHWTRRGGQEFQQVAETHGSDVTHLMQAVRELSRFYGLIHRVISIVVILVLLGIAIAGLYLLLSVRTS